MDRNGRTGGPAIGGERHPMIRKTVRIYQRRVRTWEGRESLASIGKPHHVERVRRETWWLLWVVPVYTREEVIGSNL